MAKRPLQFLRDRTVFLVQVSEHGSQMRDKGNPGALLIDVQAQLTIKKQKPLCQLFTK